MATITIILPIYNAETTLPRCINSILNQNYRDFQLILVDDGSTDSSPQLCDKFAQADDRIRVLHQSNGGASFARNVALRQVQTEFITFCDADDYVDSQWLELFIRNSDNADLIVQGINMVPNIQPDQTTGLGTTFHGTVQQSLELLIDTQVFGSLCNKMFRTEILHKNNLLLDTNIKFREDEEFLLRYLLFAQYVRYIPYAGYNYVIPNWAQKYAGNNMFYPSLSMYKSCRKIYRNEPNPVLNQYQIWLTQEAISVMYKERRYMMKYLYLYIKAVKLSCFRRATWQTIIAKIGQFHSKSHNFTH